MPVHRPDQPFHRPDQFTGLTNCYRCFVPKYAELAAPLTALCSPAQALEWTAAAQASFDILKNRLTTAPALQTHPRRRCQVVIDASGLAVSVILMQPDDEEVQHPVANES